MELQLKEGSVTELEMVNSKLPVEPFHLPFGSKLSFVPLIRNIEQIVADRIPGESEMAQLILDKLAAAPVLYQPVVDIAVLDEHRDLINLMLLILLPLGERNAHLLKISTPFRMDTVYASPALRDLLAANDVHYEVSNSENLIYCASLIRACSMILNKFYNQQIHVDPPIHLAIRREDNSLERYFRTQMHTDFMDIVPTRPLRPLTQDQIDQLMSNIYDTDLWLKLIPPDAFEFRGFIVANLIDITEDEALSRIKHKLLRRDAIVNRDNVLELEQLLRTYFDLPDLRLGLTAIDYPTEFTVAHQYKIRFDLLADFAPDLLDEAYQGSIYERVCEYREMLLIEDLRKLEKRSPLEDELLRRGIRSIIVAPLLTNDNRVIGLVEVASPTPYEMHSFVELKFQDIRGLFRTAVSRSREEIDNRIEAVLREQFTSLHSSVEWRFMDASFQLLEQQESGERGQIEPIVFEDVYPLYGQADIVDSSVQRNEAIRADIIDNLMAARTVLLRLLEMIEFPLANHILIRLDYELAHLRENFNSNDETRIVEFLFTDVHPLFEQLRKDHRGVRELVQRYFDRLDADFGIIYAKRKDYETSVATLNQRIGMYLDAEQERQQKVLPHYFERYKTDGVEYNMYVGQSLLKRASFSPVHLQNFRLSQLIQMCEITRLVHELTPQLAVPLTTAQLIFAYTNTLSILFRTDEKRFDVEGAYNVRYEILKKRIDKARIEGTDERLTQTGQVAIVYLQDKDRDEYLTYLDYLHHEGYIDGPVETHTLSALQGVQGLKALRFKVKL